MLLDLLEPVAHVVERFFARDVIGQENTVRAPVEDACDRPERLLPRSVPYLKLHYLILYMSDEGAELDTNSHLVLNFEVVVHDPRQQATLSNAYTLIQPLYTLPVSPMMMSL